MKKVTSLHWMWSRTVKWWSGRHTKLTTRKIPRTCWAWRWKVSYAKKREKSTFVTKWKVTFFNLPGLPKGVLAPDGDPKDICGPPAFGPPWNGGPALLFGGGKPAFPTFCCGPGVEEPKMYSISIDWKKKKCLCWSLPDGAGEAVYCGVFEPGAGW